MPGKIAITFDEKNKPTTKGGTFYVTINGEKTSKRYRWCIYKKGNGNPFINEIKEDKKPLKPMKFGSFGKDGGTFIIKIYDIEKVKEKKNSELSNFSEEASLEIEIKKEEEKVTTRHNIEPKILEVHLMKEGEGSITKVSYQDTLIAFAKTQGLQGKKIHFHLWENDKQENDSKHSYSTKEFSAEVEADNIARLRIPLITHQKTLQYLANRYLPQGANGEGTEHEFCVTASFGILEKHSNEVQVKREIQKAYFVDKDKNKITKIEVGDVIQVCIESTGMIGAAVKYTIWEKDGKTKKERMEEDDPVYQSGLFYLWEDQYYCNKITVDKEFFERGKYLWEGDSESQNYSIEVHTFRDSKKSKPFELVYEDVEVKYGKSPVKVEVGEVKKEENKEEKKEEPLEEGACPYCHKKHIDLRSKIKFKPQGKGNLNCNLTCREILSGIKEVKKDEDENKQVVTTTVIMPEGAGIESKAYPNNKWYECEFQLADENKERNKLIFRDIEKINKAYEYLDKSLEHGLPVMVGVNHTFNYKPKDKIDKEGKKYKDYINETTTDHYVVIVGRECDNGSIKYRFWDVGSSKGDNDWFFEKQEDGIFTASKTHNSKEYTITQIRRNIRKITEEITNKKTNEKTKNEIITY